MATSDRLAMKVPSAIAEIPRVAEQVEAFCEKSGVPSKTIYHFNLAIEEALTNIISYGFADKAPHEIALDIEWRDPQLIATVSDDGKPFDPLSQPKPNVAASIEDRVVGGLGIHLLRTLMDKVEYRRINERNQLTFQIKAKR